MQNLQELFPVTAASFDTPTVDGRKLHEWLGVQSNFTTWAKRCIETLRLTNDDDFLTISSFGNGSGGSAARPVTEFMFSVDAAKMIGMATKTDKGNEVRRYFLACEKSLLSKPETLALPLLPAEVGERTIAAMLRVSDLCGVPKSYSIQVAASEATRQTGMPWDKLLTQAEAMNNIPHEEVMLEPTELGKLFNLSGKMMNLRLVDLGLQEKVAGEWVPTEDGATLCTRHAWTTAFKSGYNLKWKAAEIEKMMNLQPLR